jgi:hypothetical protein
MYSALVGVLHQKEMQTSYNEEFQILHVLLYANLFISLFTCGLFNNIIVFMY